LDCKEINLSEEMHPVSKHNLQNAIRIVYPNKFLPSSDAEDQNSERMALHGPFEDA
jgi:hypothetical protein